MLNYCIRRLILMVPTLIGVVTITFFISEFVPGGPVDQALATLEGKSNEGVVSEIGAPGTAHGKLKRDQQKISEREMQRIYRQYGLHLSMVARYLRTFIWYQRDSISSSQEVEENSSQKLYQGKTPYLLIRKTSHKLTDKKSTPEELEKASKYNEYFLYKNLYETEKLKEFVADDKDAPASSELFYDAKTGELACAIAPEVTFELKTGKCLKDGFPDLVAIPLDIRNRTLTYVKRDDGVKKEETIEREEIYVEETLGKGLTNWNNWHGFFLLKFGRSNSKNKTVFELIVDRLPISVRLGVFSFFCTYTICILLGIIKAVKNGTRFDSLTSATVLVGYSIPGFVLAVFLLKLVGPAEPLIGSWFPGAGIHATDLEGYSSWPWWKQVLNNIHHLVLPLICLSIGSFAVLTMLTKNSILEQSEQLYAVAARARGLSERKVLFKHVFRNSLIPLVTGFPASFLMMFFAGSLLIEKIFSLNGLGYLSFEALRDRDFPIIMSNLFIFTAIGLMCRLLTDVCYVIVDPRISFEASKS